MKSDLRIRLFEQWFAAAKPGSTFVYHRGELARDRRDNPELGDLADRVLKLSDCSKPIVSECGHVRGWIHGTGDVRLFTRRDRDTMAHVAVRR